MLDLESEELSYQFPSSTLSSVLFIETEKTFMSQLTQYFGKVENVDSRIATKLCFTSILNTNKEFTSVLVGCDDGMILKLNFDYLFHDNQYSSIDKPYHPFVEKEFVNPYIAPEGFILKT